MSPRAAWRLESMGFTDAYDYVGSKVDWIGEGLPFEGSLAATPRLSTLADPDVATCAPTDTVADVRGRLGAWELALVVSGEPRILLGLVRVEALGLDDGRRVEQVMREGPSTYRPHITAAEMSHNLTNKPAPWVIVTTLSGHLIGVARPESIHAAAAGDVAG